MRNEDVAAHIVVNKEISEQHKTIKAFKKFMKVAEQTKNKSTIHTLVH